LNNKTWDSLIGCSLPEAKEALQAAGVAYRTQFTYPPGKKKPQDTARVIAVRKTEKVTLICAFPDWTVI